MWHKLTGKLFEDNNDHGVENKIKKGYTKVILGRKIKYINVNCAILCLQLASVVNQAGCL